MIKPLATLAALLLACAAFAQAPLKAPEEPNPGVKAVEQIFACLAPGLTKDWRSATVEVIEIASSGNERQFEARYTYTDASDATPRQFQPCDATSPAKRVHALNDFLEPEKRQWKRAILTFSSDGKFELKYDYAE